MKQRPILFSGSMVRAILNNQKTQTRRIMKTQPVLNDHFWEVYGAGWSSRITKVPAVSGHSLAANCPFGKVGDQLWVRETWGVVSNAWDEDGTIVPWRPNRPAIAIKEMPFGNGYFSGHVIYAADGSFEWAGDDDGDGEPRTAWKPSIHMPRAASRITLEIASVRVERLQDISEEDAKAEGIETEGDDWRDYLMPHTQCCPTPRSSFRTLWESINGAESWEANPWVWVIEFKRVTA